MACRAISADASRPCATRRQRSSRLPCGPRRLSDAIEVFGLQRLLPGRELVAIGMGMPGIATRVLAARAGSCWTYAGDGWAPGQVPAAQLLRNGFRFRAISRRHGCLRRGRTADRPFTLAGDAQRGVRGRGDRRGVSPARGRGRRRLPGLRAGRRPAGRERDGAVQGVAGRATSRSTTRRAVRAR